MKNNAPPIEFAACDGSTHARRVKATLRACELAVCSPLRGGRAVVLLPVLAILLLAPAAQAVMTRTVQNLNDSGPGSLRQTLQEAGNGDIINFSLAARGTIVLTSGELYFDRSQTTVEIQGPGANFLTISGSGNPSHRVLRVTTGTILLWHLTIANGQAVGSPDGHGGGILIRDNGRVGAGYCVFANNRARESGGAVAGYFNALNCSFHDNRATLAGGAYSSFGYISFGDRAFTLIGCSFARNVAGVYGGAIVNNPSLGPTGGEIFSCTLFDNSANVGGGVYSAASPLKVRNSIIADNRAADTSGPFVSQGFNLIGNRGESTGWGAQGDRIGYGRNAIDPKLSFHPATGNVPRPFVVPLPGSPAIDQGIAVEGTANVDLRGQPRRRDIPEIANAPGGDGTDIGAVEVARTLSYITRYDDSNLMAPLPGTVRRALIDAGLSTEIDGYQITFNNTTPQTIPLQAELFLDQNTYPVYMDGPGANLLTLSGRNQNRVFRIRGGETSIAGVTISDGYALGGGGVEVVGGAVALTECVLWRNGTSTSGATTRNGGALENLAGTVTVKRSVIAFNAGNLGAGLYNNSSAAASMTVVSSTLAYNTGKLETAQGVALFNRADSVGCSIGDCTIAGNTMAAEGAGAVDAQSTIRMHNSVVAANTSRSGGPADVGGRFASDGFNFIGSATGSNGFGAVGDRFGSGLAPLNPLLGPLQDNGGPVPTMAPLPGSPLLETQVAPTLSIRLGTPVGGTNPVILSWPNPSSGYLLQQTPNMTAAGDGWVNVSQVPSIVGPNKEVALPASGRFCMFRLRLSPGSALSLDGVNDFVHIRHSTALTISNRFTVEFWFRPTSFPNEPNYLLSHNGLNSVHQAAVIFGYSALNEVEFYALGYSGASPRVGSRIVLPDTAWHHLAYSYDATNWAGYLDGAQIFNVTRTFSLSTLPNDWIIGTAFPSASSDTNYVAGDFDEVRIWNVGRSGAQIQDSMRRPLTGNETGLIGYWRFDEGIGLTARNETPRGQDATLVNGPAWILRY